MADQWYYASDGRRHGPITDEQLQSLAQSGQLRSSDLVWTKGMDKWMPAQTIKGLVFASPAPLEVATPTAPADPPLGFLDELQDSPGVTKRQVDAVRPHTVPRRIPARKKKSAGGYVFGAVVAGAVLLVGAFLMYHSMNDQKAAHTAAATDVGKDLGDRLRQDTRDARAPQSVTVPGRSTVPVSMPEVPDVQKLLQTAQEDRTQRRSPMPDTSEKPHPPHSPVRRQREPNGSAQGSAAVVPTHRGDVHEMPKNMTPIHSDMFLIDAPEAKVAATGRLLPGDAKVVSLTFVANRTILLAEVMTNNGLDWFTTWDTETWKELPVSGCPPKINVIPLKGQFTVNNAIPLGGPYSVLNRTVALSPDGKLLVTSYGDIWNLASRPLRYIGHVEAWGSQSREPKPGLPSLSYDNRILVLPNRAGFEPHGLQFIELGRKPRLLGVTPKPDPKRGLLETSHLDMWTGLNETLLQAVALAPQGNVLAVVKTGSIVIYSVPNGQVAATLKVPNEAKTSHNIDSTIQLGFSSDGSTLATVHEVEEDPTARRHQVVALWDTATWKQRASLSSLDVTGFRGYKNEVNFGYRCSSPDGTRIVTTAGSLEREITVTIWDSLSGQKISEFFAPCKCNIVAFTPDSHHIITYGPNPSLFSKTDANPVQEVYIWDAATGLLCGKISGSCAEGFALAPDGKLLVTVSLANDFTLWDITKGKRVPCEDIYAEYRIAQAADSAEAERLRKPAAPITKQQYDEVRLKMNGFQVRKIMAGSGKSSVNVYTVNEGRFGVSYLTRTTYTYPCIDGNEAVFIFEGKGSAPPLVEKRQTGGW